ncbi:MAG: hypothetical protein Q7K54_06295 [Candidatus Parcubacteria bacterium]|nr:hypothetical protein [Candidatus Parcubacteria bacterium]
MEEIIHVNFKNREVIEKNQSEIEPIKEAGVGRKLGSEVGNYAKFMQFVLLGSAKELMNLHVSPTSLHQSRELVKSYDTEELIGWLEKTDENEWKKKAAFFQAIFNELRFRLDMK